MADYSEKIEGMADVFPVEGKAIRAIVHPILVLLRMVHKQNVLLKEAVDAAQNASADERGEHVKKICELLEPGNDDEANCSRKVLMRLKTRVIRFGHTGIIREFGEYLKVDFDCVKESTAALFSSLRAFYATEDLNGAWLAISRVFELLETSDGLFFASEESYAEEVEYAFSEFIRYCERNVQDLKERFLSPVAFLQAEVKGLRKGSKAVDKGLRMLGRKTDAVLYEVSEDHAFGKPLTVSDQADEMRQGMLGEAIGLVVDCGETNLRAVARQVVEKYEEKRGGYKGESGIKALGEQLRRKLVARGIVAKAACEGAKTTLKKTTLKGKTTLKKTTLKKETNLKGTGQKILACMQEDAGVTIPELMRATGLSRDGVKYQLRVLKDGGYLRREGGRKMGRWVLGAGAVGVEGE